MLLIPLLHWTPSKGPLFMALFTKHLPSVYHVSGTVLDTEMARGGLNPGGGQSNRLHPEE